MMEKPLQLLIVEDDENDAELIARNLRRDGFHLEFERVFEEAAFRAALSSRAWNLIIADYSQPSFNGLRALQIYAEHNIDIPFIIISGTVGEEVAVEAMRAGAHDYLLKDKLVRLGPLVRRELRDAQSRADRRRAEAALRESEERFRMLVENISDLLMEVGSNGDIRYASPNHLSVLGYPAEEMLGRNFSSFVHPEDRSKWEELLTKGTETVVGYRAFDRRQALRWFESSGKPSRTFSGEERIVVITRDVTERMQAQTRQSQLEAQLRQSQKMEAIGTLAGGIAHDFNNLLTGIIGNIQLAQLEAPPGQLIAQPLGDALSASYRARDLVGQILTFSRRHDQKRTPGDLGIIVSEAVRLLRASLPPTVSIQTRLGEGCSKVLCESTQIHQIIMNLGTNAAHAMRESGGTLSVAVDTVTIDAALRARYPQLSEGPSVRLTVADTGAGIPADILERIFEPFFTTKPVGEGTGLGLAVVHGIIQSHDAAVTVDSVLGRGTTFRIYFPPIQAKEMSSTPPHDSVPRGNGETVFLVDDETGVASLGTRMLEKLNYKPVAFTQAADALAAIRRDPQAVRILITDLAMPGLSGLDLARNLLELNPKAVVIVSTGMMRALDRDHAAAIGIRFSIQKPFTFADFANTLAKAVKSASATT